MSQRRIPTIQVKTRSEVKIRSVGRAPSRLRVEEQIISPSVPASTVYSLCLWYFEIVLNAAF